MNPIRTAALLPLLALSTMAASRPITETALARHVDVLASDAYEGRKPGTPGAIKAVTYIAAAFRDAGLVPGAADGGWYQTVRFVERTPEASAVRFGERTESEIVLNGREARVALADVPVVFAGYGLPGIDLAVLTQADVRGAIVLIRSGTPKGVETPLRPAQRIAALLDRGAVGVVTIQAADAKWDTGQRAAMRPGTMLEGARRPQVQGVMSHAAFLRLAPAAAGWLALSDGRDPRGAPPALGRATITATTTIRRFASWNVIGRRAGTGGAGEAVLFTGHWDHLGICRPEGAPDRICNGAVDNASGIASMIETARELGRDARPVRDAVFIATTGEELGLLGMEAWADTPTVPLGKVVAAINVDTVAIAPRGLPVAIVGRGLTRLDPIIDATARRIGRTVDSDLEANAFVDRQDGAVLVRRGVPAVMIGGSFSDIKRLQAFLGSVYHGPGDGPGGAIALGGAAEDADLTVAVARQLLDPAAYPAR